MHRPASRPGLRGVRPPRPAPPSNDLLTLAGAVLRAPSGHAARPALRVLASRGRSPTGLRPSLIVLSALLAAPTHCTPEIVTALAATLKRTGDLAAAQTIAQQRARLGSQPQQETGALAAVIEACQRLALREITAGLTVALALRPPTRRWALPQVEATAVAAAQRYVQRHVPGLLALLQTGHAVASLRDERLQLGPAAVTEARVRQRPQPTALTRRPRWLPEDEPQRPARPLPAPRPTSILPHLPIWQALGQPFPALQVQLLAAGRPTAQMRAVQFFRDRPSAMSVLILIERLLQCHRRREEALRQVVCAALVALQPAGGWLALAASMLLHPSTFTSAIRALALAPALPSDLAADLTWLCRRLDDGHPPRRERPLALAVVSRADDRDLRTGLALARHMRPEAGWTNGVNAPLPAAQTVQADAEARLPGLWALLRHSGEQHRQGMYKVVDSIGTPSLV